MNPNGLQTPFVVTPISKYLSQIQSLQWHPLCADFELNTVLCYESYGYRSPKCSDYLEDLRECLYGFKQALRTIAMQNERELQYKEGTRKDLYKPPPPDHSY